MIGYKLMRQRVDGSLGSLFINRRQRLETGHWYPAEKHQTNGFSFRPGWHIMAQKLAPHLVMNEERVWVRVEFKNFKRVQRPATQGGLWYLADNMMILEIV